jgi:hypothetical protein
MAVPVVAHADDANPISVWPRLCLTDLVWRVKTKLRLPCEKRLSDDSYLSTIYPSQKDRRRSNNGIRVRVIEYTLEGVVDGELLYRL